MGDYREIKDIFEEALDATSKESRALPHSRFWGLVFLALVGFVSIPLTAYFYFAKIPSSLVQDLEDQKQKVKDLASGLARADAATAAERNERIKNLAEYEAKLRDYQQQVAKLDVHVQENVALKAKVAALEGQVGRVKTDLLKSLLAAGATPLTPSYGPVPRRPNVPRAFEELNREKSDEQKKSRCLKLKDFEFCE